MTRRIGDLYGRADWARAGEFGTGGGVIGGDRLGSCRLRVPRGCRSGPHGRDSVRKQGVRSDHGGVPSGGGLGSQPGIGKVLVADLDSQTSCAHRIPRVKPNRRAGDSLDNVRRMNAASWAEFATAAGENPELLAGWETGGEAIPSLSEPWRIEGMFRFLIRNYSWILAHLVET
jgi:hypothetical protein